MESQSRSTENKSEDQLHEKTVVDPPDGGTKAWCTLLGGWLALFATFGYATSFGVYQDLYTRGGTSSSSNISWIGSLQLFFNVILGLPAGALLDKGYFRPVIVTGTIIYIFSLFMLSLAHLDSYYQIFLSQGVGVGIGCGLIYVPSMAIQAHNWRARRVLAMGFVVTGSSVGGIVYPIMLNNLFHGSVGFAWGVRASAFLTLGLLIIANLLMTAPVIRKGDVDKPKPKPRELFSDVPYLLSIAGGFLTIWGLFFAFFYLQLFTILHGLSPTFAFYTLTIQNAASIPGRMIPTLFADKFGVINTTIAMVFGSGVLVFALFGVTNTAGVVVFAILYGFFAGAVLALLSPLIASFSRDVSEVGMRIGLAYTISSTAWLTGPPIAGALLGNGHWFKPIIFNGTILLAAVPFLVASRFMQAKRRNTPYV